MGGGRTASRCCKAACFHSTTARSARVVIFANCYSKLKHSGPLAAPRCAGILYAGLCLGHVLVNLGTEEMPRLYEQGL